MSSKGWQSIHNISIVTVLFGIVLLFFIWGGLYFVVQNERRMELDNAAKETSNYAHTFAEHTLRTIRGLDEITLFLKYQAEREGLFLDLPRLVKEGRFVGQPFVLLSIQNENGDVVASSQVPFGSVNHKDREHFIVHTGADSGALFISKPVVGRISGKWTIQLTRRINKADGSFGGIVVVGVDPNYFAQFYKQVDLGEQSVIAIIGRDGVLRVRQSGDEIHMGTDLSSHEAVKKLSVGDKGTFINQSPIDGITRIRSYRALEEYPLLVLTGVTEEHVFKALNQRLASYYWACGAASAVVVLFVGLLLRGIVRRKQAEDALRRETVLSEALFDSVPGMLYLYDGQGKLIRWNRQHEKMTGYSSAELSAMHLRDWYEDDEETYARITRKIEKAYKEGFAAAEADLKTKGGAKIPLYFTAVPLTLEGESYFAGIGIDISERKRLEHELRLYAANLEEKVERRTQELFAANQELTAVNEELTAMNEEMIAMNESLEDANRDLTTEVGIRQQKEQELLLREKQYRATTGLLTQPGEDIDGLLKSILQDAVQLVGAPGGEISLLDGSGKYFVFPYAVGIKRGINISPQPIEAGMLGQVYKSGEMLHVEDYRQYLQRIPEPRFDRLTTILMAPLKRGGEIKGVLSANWQNDIHPVTTEDMEIFRQFGVLASIAIERANANTRITNQNKLLQQLAETTAFLVHELDMEKALQNILVQATSFMGIPHGFIQLFEPDGRHSVIQCGLGRYKAQVGNRLSFSGAGIVAEVMRTGKPMAIDDYANWPQRLRDPFYADITAAMQAPLNVDGKTTGSIGLTLFGEPVVIDKEKLAIFEQFATIAAIAIKNALAHQETNRLAFYDTLTGLPNRAHLNRRLEEEMKQARKGEAAGALMFIDLDDLKTVNDHLGHTYGDSVIAAAGQDIVRTVGEEAYVARAGGDEFVVLLPGAGLKQIDRIADRLIESIRKEYEVRGQRIHMTTSIGIALYPIGAATAEEILKNADIAMYAAKAAGKNSWRFYEPEMQKDPYDQMVLTNSLRHALADGELSLYYQPQIELSGRKVVGFEALLRWNSKEHGVIPPARFIPLAERRGLIQLIGQWVIEEACRFARKIADGGHPEVHVAVNVSPRQLSAEDFVDRIRKSIDEAGIAPEQLEVEITENVLLESLEDSTAKLIELSALGVRLSLDDFGTGYSSLTYLRNLPVGTLKIDKTFIDRMLDGKVEEGFIRSIVDMAHVLDLNVVAEGVETEAQLAKLAQFGCDCVQGYVFSKPVSQEAALCFSIYATPTIQ